jgi:phage recombination protein Bet
MSEIVLLRNQPDRLRELRDSVAKGASDAEFGFFVSVCDRLGLCPFNRQIFLIERWDSQLGRNVKTPQVSIDGFRLVAQRSREYQGQTQTMWADSDGRWSDLWTSADPPFAAKVGVWRDGFKEPLIATALWSEYAARKKDGSVMPMWKKMPALMLAKCAEALALRKAFPAELSGLYTTDEMAQASVIEGESFEVDRPRAQPKAKVLPTSQDRAAEAAALMDPTPVGQPARPAVIDAKPLPARVPEMVVLGPDALGDQVGKWWKVQAGGVTYAADETVASVLEANAAFQVSVVARVIDTGKTPRIGEILRDATPEEAKRGTL